VIHWANLRCRVWDRLKNSELPPSEDELAKWEAEYNQIMQSQRYEFDYGGDMENAWKSGFRIQDEDLETAKFDDEGTPILEPYKFGGTILCGVFDVLTIES
jgi:peroxin-5